MGAEARASTVTRAGWFLRNDCADAAVATAAARQDEDEGVASHLASIARSCRACAIAPAVMVNMAARV